MNQEKAREFFSNYYEGNLEPGLAQALGQALARDGQLRDDYRQFEAAYEDLGNLKFEAIEVPFDLNNRIGVRIDRHIYDERRSKQPAWTFWVRNAAIAGVSAIAIVGAALSLRKAGDGTQSAGSLVIGAGKDELSFSPVARGAKLQFVPDSSKVLIIRDGLKGKVRRQVSVDPNGLSTTLENPNTQPTVFDVEVQGDPRQSLIALPGSARTEGKVGEGNLEDFAKALAGRYRIPVEIHVAEPNVSVSWNFEAADPEGAASQTLSASRYNIDRLGNGMLVISDPGA